MKDKVLVTSYVNPDLDGIASSYAYAELLRKTGINAVAGIFGKPHTEAEFVFSKIDVKLMKGDKLIKACDGVVLVDVSSAHNMSKKINPKKVVEIIDHREQKARDFPNAKMQIERVGACATLIAEKFYDKKIKISKESALFLYSAIVSNTINFKGRVTTKRDKNLAEWLKQFFEMPKNHVYEMFKYKSKIGSSLKRFMIQDFKVIYSGSKKIGIFQLEIIDSKKFIAVHLKEIIKILDKTKKEKELDLIFLACVDIEKGFNIFVVIDDETKNLLEKILKIKFKGNTETINKIVLRKEITPLIKKHLENEIPHNPHEVLAVVDDNDNIIGKTTRKDVHINGMLHREASVLIVNSRNEILLQKRADNGKLDYSASGHFPINEDYSEGAVREIKEELGLDVDKRKLVKIVKLRIDYSGRFVNNRFITLFEVRGDYSINDVDLNKGEVSSIGYFSVAELKRIIKKNPEKMGRGLLESLKTYLKMRKV